MWNRQPDGGSIGLGTSPSRVMRSRSKFLRGSGIGTADSKALVFVRLGKGNSELGLYDVKTGQSLYAATPFEKMATPAISPSGRQVAVAATSAVKASSAICCH